MFARTKILTASCSSSLVSRLRSSFTGYTLLTDTMRKIPSVADSQTPSDEGSDKHKERAQTFYRSDLVTTPALPSERQPKPTGALPFDKYYSDHMIDVDWTAERGWARPNLHKVQPLQLHPENDDDL